MNTLQEQIARHAKSVLAQHVMTVKQCNGLNRVYECKRPNSGAYAFTVRTWPGWILVHGDVGFLALSRIDDMLLFCRDSIDSIDYFAEKVPREIVTKMWSSDLAREWIDVVCKDDNEYGIELNQHDQEKLQWLKDSDEISESTMFYQALVNNTEYFAQHDHESFPDCRNFTPGFYWCRECIKWLLEQLGLRGAE